MSDRRPADKRALPRPRSILLVTLLLASASIFDAFATLELIARGAEEWNPVMRYALGVGDWYFVMVKLAVTALVGLLLCGYARTWRWVWIALCSVTLFYLALVGLHFFLLYGVPPALATLFF